MRLSAAKGGLMYVRHSADIWRDFPGLAAAAVFAAGIDATAGAASRIAAFTAVADTRLAGGTEAELPEIRAWRRAFSRMGLKPTQYRCAAESLLRRYRKERALPRINPVVDLCNAVSLAYAIPVAAFDVSRIDEFIEVRYASGDEDYLAFSGQAEHPASGEVIFADAAGRAHARRWTNRQSAYSAVSDATASVLIVAEALHDTAARDVPGLAETICAEVGALCGASPAVSAIPAMAVLTQAAPRFDFRPQRA